jgi:triphosphoribosyl-dephospho-CoA synthase
LPGLTVGQRVLRSIEATRSAVACNTNLGIVLLCAPLIQAAFVAADAGSCMQVALQQVLLNLDRSDSQDVFAAIRLAKPAGLGQRQEHDVASQATTGLREIMASAAQQDRIAYQYAHNFIDVYDLGLPTLQSFLAKWQGRRDCTAWAMVACYVGFMSAFPDSHIQRKYGEQVSERVRKMAKRLETGLKACENPVDELQAVQEFDEKLKREGLNPGTSADLAVASLLSFYLDGLFADVHTSRSVSSPEAA